MVEKMKHVVVIGGGAAGFFGAIACAEANPDLNVTIMEAGGQPLRKVKISGGGRCNVTHSCFDPEDLVAHYPRGHRALRGPFRQFQPRNTVEWFKQRGVRLKTESDGRMFPTTDQSQTIIDCLMDQVSRHRISVRTRSQVASVNILSNENKQQKEDNTVAPFVLNLKSGETVQCDRLLLATGSSPQGYRLAKDLGHTIVPPVPSLFTFTIRDTALHSLAGIAMDSVRARLITPKAKPLEQIGPLLITHWGMSGPAVLKLSAWGARILHDCRYQATLRITWLPRENQESVRQQLFGAKTEWAKKSVASIAPVALPRRFWRYLLTRSGIDPQLRWADLSKKAINRLNQTLMQDDYAVTSKGVFKDEFVTCGGVRLKEVNFKTMESRSCPGVFFAGEVLDIDGVTGGFNFQNAWTTGWIAGQALAS